MSDLNERLSILWRQMQQRNDWQIISADQEPVFLNAVAGMFAQQPPIASTETPHNLQSQIRFRYAQELYYAVLDWWHNPEVVVITQRADRACGEIWQIVWRMMVSTFQRDDHLAQDIAQSVVLRLLEDPTKVDKPERFLSWLKWQIRDFLGRKVYRTEAGIVPHDDERSSPQQETEDATIKAEDDELIQQALALIRTLVSPFQYDVIRLVAFEGRKAQSVAEHLGVPAHRVRIEKSRGLARLRESGHFDYLREDGCDEQS